jgi:AcrR family transcriptional regulator
MVTRRAIAKAETGGVPTGRGARRRQETRARLLHAAREVMARKGVGATSIQEITETADVGFGSFYNHFASKEAIADAVMEDAIEAFGDAADRMAEHVDDAAEVLAASIRHAVLRASRDEAWGWFLIRTGLTRTDGVKRGLGRRLARDIQIGIDARRFTAADPTAATIAAGGIVLSVIASHLHGTIGKDAPERAATMVLRLLGVAEREARQVSKRTLPPI